MTLADLVIKVSAQTGPAQRDLNTFAGKTQGIFRKGLLPAVGVLGVLGVAAKKTTNDATALGESQNAVNVVFGKGAKKIHAFAKVADKQAGLSMRQLNELVTPVGASFRNMGDGADVAAGKSITLAKRAADMASVFNTSVPDAMQAVQAALRGEGDPIEKFGVKMNESAVSAKAMAMGLAKTKGALTDQDKAQARYALLLEQTNRYQGDFANTAGSAANQARINAAAQENLSASIGTGLLPAVKLLQSVMGAVIGAMAKHPDIVKVLAAALGILAVAVIAVNVAFMLAASPVLLVIVALVALGAALAILWVKCETFRNIVTAVWEHIKAITLAVWPAVKAIITTYITGAVAVVRTYVGIAKTVLTTAWNVIKAVTQAVWPVIKTVITTAMSAVKAAVDIARGAIDLVRAAIEKVKSPAETVAGIVKGALSKAFDALKGATGGIRGLLSGIASVLDRIASAAETAADALGRLKDLAGKIPGVGGGVPFVPGIATGGTIKRGGWAVVGERGPELVNLPGGSTVYSNRESRGAGGDRGGDGGRNAPLIGEVHVHDNSDAEVLARRVERVLAFG